MYRLEEKPCFLEFLNLQTFLKLYTTFVLVNNLIIYTTCKQIFILHVLAYNSSDKLERKQKLYIHKNSIYLSSQN